MLNRGVKDGGGGEGWTGGGNIGRYTYNSFTQVMFTRFRISRLLRHLDLSVSFHIQGKTLCILALKTKQNKNKKTCFQFLVEQMPMFAKGRDTPVEQCLEVGHVSQR